MHTNQHFGLALLLGVLVSVSLPVTGAESDASRVSLSGTLQSTVCAQACGTCCGSVGFTDTSGNISFPIGNSFVDLVKIVDDGQAHQINGHFYNAPGQCGENKCSLFAVETSDEPDSPAAIFQPATGRLSIQSVVIDGDAENRPFVVNLEPPYTVSSAIARDELETIPQGGDCSAINAVCSNGTVCLSYYGIAGANGPEFKTCEIPCSFAGAGCPLGQSCATIADGPGQVCTVD